MHRGCGGNHRARTGLRRAHRRLPARSPVRSGRHPRRGGPRSPLVVFAVFLGLVAVTGPVREGASVLAPEPPPDVSLEREGYERLDPQQIFEGFEDDADVAATVKHFPGHGDTSIDSHVGLPTIDHSTGTWWELDAPPFEAAIEAGVDIIEVLADIGFGGRPVGIPKG